jgi:methyl-accepting chemotaxis protein
MLSERSQEAATEINELASSAVAITEKAGEMMKRLVPDIQKTAELVQEISAASQEQNTGTEQINRALQQLEQVTQQNSARSEELSTTAQELAAQAEHLRHAIMLFQVDEVDRQPLEQAQEKAQSPSHFKIVQTKPDKDIENGEFRDDQDNEFERF